MKIATASPPPHPAAPAIVSVEAALATDNARLERELAKAREDIASLRARSRMLYRALNGQTSAVHIATLTGEARLEPTVRTAQLLEREGRVPIVKWARNAAGVLVGIELAVLVTPVEAQVTLEAPVRLGGMSVVS
jgi:hypothetical protein